MRDDPHPRPLHLVTPPAARVVDIRTRLSTGAPVPTPVLHLATILPFRPTAGAVVGGSTDPGPDAA